MQIILEGDQAFKPVVIKVLLEHVMKLYLFVWPKS